MEAGLVSRRASTTERLDAPLTRGISEKFGVASASPTAQQGSLTVDDLECPTLGRRFE